MQETAWENDTVRIYIDNIEMDPKELFCWPVLQACVRVL